MTEILDASALLAFLKEEKGFEKIKKLLLEAHKNKFTVFIHQVNYVEVVRKLIQNFGINDSERILAQLSQPFLGVANYLNDEMATYTTRFSLETGISLADSIGLSFTKVMEGRFWTADKALQSIAEKEKINFVLIR